MGTKVNFLYEIQSIHLCYCHFHFGPLTFNPTIAPPSKNHMQLGANLSSKGLNCAKNKFEDQIKIFIKINYFNP